MSLFINQMEKVCFPWKIIHFLCERYLQLARVLCAPLHVSADNLAFLVAMLVWHIAASTSSFTERFLFCAVSSQCMPRASRWSSENVHSNDGSRTKSWQKMRCIFNAQMHLHEHLHVHNTPIILLVKRAQNSNMWSGNSVSPVIQPTLAQLTKYKGSEHGSEHRGGWEKKRGANYRNKEIKNRLGSYLCEIPIHLLCAGNCIANWCWLDLSGNSMAQTDELAH